MKKRILSLAIAFCVCLTLLPTTAKATSKTADEAISWAKSQVGHSVGYDDGSGYYQCVEFIQAYYEWLGVDKVRGNGADYATNALPSGWTRTPGGIPQKGDILVYSSYSSRVQQYGHVAIYESDNALYDQDGSVYGATVKKENKNYRTYTYNYWGCIHPNFASSAQALSSEPKPTVDRGQDGAYYTGENVTISLDGSYSSSYILKIYHTPTGGSTYLYWEGEIFSNQYTTSFSKEGYYSCVFVVDPWGAAYDSGWVGWLVKEKEIPITIALNQSAINTEVGESKMLSATVSPSGTPVTWSSSNTSVATVSNGRVTGVKAGTATITATAGDKSANCTVTVADKNVAVQSVTLNNTTLALSVGESGALTASVNPSNATNKTVTWSSSNTSVATVSNGRVTGVKAGMATITAAAGGKTATCAVTVTDKNVAVQSVTLNNTTLALAVGESGTLTASVNPSNASDKTVTWSSSDTSVATVSNGRVTALKAGSATITATAGGKTASCAVTVKEKAVAVESVTMSRTDLSLTVGDQTTLSATVLPSNATNNTITWSSSNTNIAAVNNGQVIAFGSGTATITATAGEKSATCRVVVAEKAKATSPSDVHFEKATIYFQDQFADVPANQWYTDSVATAFELGLMKGDSGNFRPFGDVTIAEAITMAARIHSIYTTGSESFDQSEGNVWYQTYLDYAFKNGVISRAYYNCDATQKANRSQFAEIFAASLPDEALAAMNEVTDGKIPDVDMSSDYASAVYRLYRAGILTGNDTSGTFAPQTYITRAEAAAIVSRMAESSLRRSLTLK